MASVTMSTIAIVVAIAAFIFLSMKGVGPLITAVLAAAFVSLFTEAGFVQSFFTDFLSGVTSMVGNMFFLLVLGAIFGGVLSATGASEKIGTTFVRVMGPIMDCQLIETALLNCVNFETLIATKAARVCLAAHGLPVAEFGLRRAQGAGGGMWASRAAVVGGCASTSNVLAGKTYGLPVSGTHAHSWVMSFPSELEAFRAYAREFPRNCVLLVDTYDVEQGIRNAITVGLEMRARGERLAGIRIDSGDLAWLAKMARRMLDEAGLDDCGIVLSNDLDEYTIQSILDEGAPVSSWGVGTKLACAFDQPTLGGVYKLSATRAPGQVEWVDRLKISESAAKLTVPGVLDVRRYYNEDGTIAGDMVFDVNSGVDEGQVIVDPLDSMRRKKLAGKRFSTMLEPLARNGQVVLDASDRSAMEAQRRCREGLACLDESQKRMLNPHTYPVGLEYGLCERRRALVGKLRGIA